LRPVSLLRAMYPAMLVARLRGKRMIVVASS
jgi:hypothetical protein